MAQLRLIPRLIRLEFAPLAHITTLVLALGLLAAISLVTPVRALDRAQDRARGGAQSPLIPITLQLRWHHQFQFAGYYAAKDKGYYREAGFDVTILARKPGGGKPIDQVLAGRAQFAIENSDVLLRRLKGQPLVALAAIFQHSAMILLARQDSGLREPHDFPGRKVFSTGNAEILAMLRGEGINPDEVDIRPSSFNIKDLLTGKTDAFAAYLTNEPYFMDKLGIPYIAIKPSTYGVDFYSDILFTTEKEIRNHPDQVKRFRQASLRGWQYAMAHPDEIIGLIRSKYGSQKTIDHLAFEANAMRGLVHQDKVEIGHMNPGRWKHMADIFVKEGMVDPGYSLQGFIYDPKAPKDTIVFLGHKSAPPYEFFKNGKPIGVSVEIFSAMGKVLGRPVEVRLYQWAEAQARFKRGEGHALSTMVINDKRKKTYDFTQSTFNLNYVLFVQSRHLAQFDEMDLSNKRIAVRRGGYANSIVENSHPEAKVTLVDNVLEGFQMLSKGQVDGVLDESLIGHHVLQQSKFKGISALPTPLSKRTAHISVIKGNSVLLGELNKAISKLKSQKIIKQISRRWLSGPVVFITRGERKAALLSMLATLAIVAILAILLFHSIAKRNKERTLAEGLMQASLTEKEVLLKEIHHRVKNNLQVISSMLSLQARSETDGHTHEALEDSQRRVKIMARIHENLHQSDDLASINAREFINTVVEDTIASSGAMSGAGGGHNGQGISSRIDVDDIVVSVDQAIVCGQIISELLANSLKHAFTPGRSGKIDISLHRCDSGTIVLAVADDGKGLPDGFEFGQAQTLGMRLVQALSNQLNGVMNIDGATGTRIQIVFPEKPV